MSLDCDYDGAVDRFSAKRSEESCSKQLGIAAA